MYGWFEKLGGTSLNVGVFPEYCYEVEFTIRIVL